MIKIKNGVYFRIFEYGDGNLIYLDISDGIYHRNGYYLLSFAKIHNQFNLVGGISDDIYKFDTDYNGYLKIIGVDLI